MSLILIAMTLFSPKTGLRWIAAFILILVASMIVHGLMLHGISSAWMFLNALLYVTICLTIGGSMAMLRRLEVAHSETEVVSKEGEQLLAELQVAHRQLQAYTGQAEELAVIAARNRMARTLYDPVSHPVLSMTLTAGPARMLIDRGASRAALELNKLQALAKSALAECAPL